MRVSAFNVGFTDTDWDEAQRNISEIMPHGWTVVSFSPTAVRWGIGRHRTIVEPSMTNLGSGFQIVVCKLWALSANTHFSNFGYPIQQVPSQSFF
jgi:hypothetical protein